jgi:hypothetical protein
VTKDIGFITEMDSIQGGDITPQQLHDQRSHFVANISDAISRCSILIAKVHNLDDKRSISWCTWRGTVTQQRVRTRRQPGSSRQYLYSDYDPINQSWNQGGQKDLHDSQWRVPLFQVLSCRRTWYASTELQDADLSVKKESLW